MKLKIIAAALFLITFATSSFAGNPTPVTSTREIAILAPFQTIRIDDNINVVLVQDPYRLTVSVSGDERNIQYIQAKIVKNQLHISSKKSLAGKKITVYVPVENVSMIELAAGASVSGEGILRFDDLTVVVSTDAHAALNVLGAVTIKSADNCDFVYEKNEKYKVIPSTL